MRDGGASASESVATGFCFFAADFFGAARFADASAFAGRRTA
jgi:hypothetical protein